MESLIDIITFLFFFVALFTVWGILNIICQRYLGIGVIPNLSPRMVKQANKDLQSRIIQIEKFTKSNPREMMEVYSRLKTKRYATSVFNISNELFKYFKEHPGIETRERDSELARLKAESEAKAATEHQTRRDRFFEDCLKDGFSIEEARKMADELTPLPTLDPNLLMTFRKKR